MAVPRLWGGARRTASTPKPTLESATPRDLDLATWMMLQTMESLIHEAVITPPPDHSMAAVEQGIVGMLAAYLCGRQDGTLARD